MKLFFHFSRNKIKEQYNILAAKYNRIMKEKDSLFEEVRILRSEAHSMRKIFEEDMINFKPGNIFETTGNR